MKLLKFVNTTNPKAPINGYVVMSEEEIASFMANKEMIMSKFKQDTKFITKVGNGFIQFFSWEEAFSNMTIFGISDIDAVRFKKLGISETGFAKYFMEGITYWEEEQFITYKENPVPIDLKPDSP